jgi:hypothetical protein
MNHPSAIKLDGFAAGDVSSEVESHLKGCDACAKYVADLKEGAAAFRTKMSGVDFAAKIVTEAKKAGEEASHATSRARMMWFAAPALAAAAAVLLFVTQRNVPIGSTEVTPTATMSSAPTDSASRFKGEVPVVVIRERDGRQSRLQGPFAMHTGDRIRIEVSLDHAQALAAGLLTKEGAWVPLLAPVTLEPGTHTPTLAASADESPTDAMLIVGAPDAVERAKATRSYAGVTAWHVTSE